MLYVGYLIIANGQNIQKKSGLKISNFELQRAENYISRLCSSPHTQISEQDLKEGLTHALHRIFDHCEWSGYAKISFGNFQFWAAEGGKLHKQVVP